MKNKNPFDRFPMLECAEGVLFDAFAICKYLSQGSALMGSSRLHNSQVTSDIKTMESQIMPSLVLIAAVIYGTAENVTTEDYNESVKHVKEYVKSLNSRKEFEVTVADIWMVAQLSTVYQTVLDAGFQKGMSIATAWFVRISNMSEFSNVFGAIKLCQK